jgi:hypothetical protein
VLKYLNLVWLNLHKFQPLISLRFATHSKLTAFTVSHHLVSTCAHLGALLDKFFILIQLIFHLAVKARVSLPRILIFNILFVVLDCYRVHHRVVWWELDGEHGSVYDLACIDLVVMLLVMLDECSRRWVVLTQCCVIRESLSMGSGWGIRRWRWVALTWYCVFSGGSTASRYEHVTSCPLGLLMCFCKGNLAVLRLITQASKGGSKVNI